MGEVFTWGLIGEEDLNRGAGTFSATLQDGSVDQLNKIGLHSFLGSAYFSVTDFPSDEAGRSINLALIALPSTGGVVDARGLTGPQTVSVNMFLGVSKPFALLLGHATFIVSVTQQLTTNANCLILGLSGAGATVGGTVFQWNGQAAGTALLFDRSRDCMVENLIIQGISQLGIGICLDNLQAPAGNVTSTHNVFRKVSVINATTGVQIGNTSTSGNDNHEFYDLQCSNISNGVWINDSQSKKIMFYGGSIAGGQYGVYVNRGSFHAYGITLSGQSLANYNLNGFDDTISIEKCRSTTSAKFFSSLNTGIGLSVNLIGNEYSPTAVAADHHYIDWGSPGTLNLLGNDFASGTETLVVTVNVGTTTAALNSIGNGYPNSTPFSYLVGAKLTSMGDRCVNNLGLSVPLPAGDLTVTGSLNVGLTTQFNGQKYTWPAVQTASNFLTTDGAGHLSWSPIAGGGGVGVSGTTNTLLKFTGPSTAGNSSVSDDGSNVALNGLPTIANNALMFANFAKQIKTDEGNLNWDSTNRRLYVGFGPITDGLSGSGQIIATGSGGVIVATANSAASTFAMNIVAGTYASMNAGKTGTGIRLPIAIFTGGHESLRLTTDPFLQLTTSYTGGTASDAGAVAFRNNAGALEISQNGGVWTPLGTGVAGSVSGSGTTGFLTKWTDGAASVLGNSLVSDDGTDIALNSLSSITNNAVIFANSSKQVKSDEGNFNWDSTNKRLYVGFGPMTGLSGSGQIIAAGSGGLLVATANVDASTMAINIVGGTYASLNSGRTGAGARLPIAIFTNTNEALRITTDPFLQLSTSYTGGTLSGSGAVALRNNAGALEISQNGGAWSPIGGSLSGVTGSGTTAFLTKWTNGAGSVLGNSLISDNGADLTFTNLPAVTNNAVLFANSTKQLKSDEGNFNWDSTNKRLYVGFGPMTGLSGTGQFVATGSGGFVAATANADASTLAMNVVAATYASINSGRVGAGARLPMVFFTNANETLRLTLDPFIQLTTSYAGGNLSAIGAVALRNNAGALEISQNAGAWTAIGTGGGGVSGSGTAGLLPVFTGSTAIGNSNISANGTNVGIGINPVDDTLRDYLEVFGNLNDSVRITLRNANTGTSGQAVIVIRDGVANTNNAVSVGVTSPGFTTSNGLSASQAYILSASGSSGGINVHANAGPIVFQQGSGTEVVKLTTDPFLQLSASYTGVNVSSAGTVAMRNNSGTLQISQNGGAWAAVSSGGISGSGAASRLALWSGPSSVTNSSMADSAGNISGASTFALGPGSLPAFTVFYGSSDTGSLYIMSYASNDAGSGANTFRKSRGTHGSPSDAQDGDAIGTILASPYSAGFQNSAKMVFRVSGIAGSGSRPGSKIEWSTNGAGGVVTLGMVLQNNQVLTLPTYGAGSAQFDGSGNLFSTSDSRLKEIQGSYTPGLDALRKIHPIRYKWNQKSGLDRGAEYAGFSAQDIKAALPLSVGTNKEGYLSLQDRAILAAVVNAINELSGKVK